VEVRDPATGDLRQVPGRGTAARQIVKEFRDANPKLLVVWNKLDAGLKLSIGSDFEVALPSGRSMRYGEVRATVSIEPDPETGKPRRRNRVTADIGGLRVSLWGSKIFENIVQATARDVFAYHLLKLEDAGLTPLFGIHDEAVIECPVDSGVTAEYIEQIMNQTPPWLQHCPVSAEAREVSCYTK